MEYAFLGGPGTETTLRLDYRAFAYAGKFVVGKPGKAVLKTLDGSPAVPEWNSERSLPPTVDERDFDDDVVAYDEDGYPPLRDFLKEQGVRHVLLTGYATDMCFCSTTAGYQNLSQDSEDSG